jgi:membrane-associated phospholipid phosphatase
MRTIKKICADHKKTVLMYAGGVVALIVFTLWAHFFQPDLDAGVSAVIRQERGQGFSLFMDSISWWGMSYWMVVTVCAASLILYLTSYKREAIFALSVFIADGINVVLKLIINRSRPEEVDIFPKFQQGSFPSGHVVHYVVFFGFILAVMLVNSRIPLPLRWGIGLLCVVLVAGVSVARIHLGTHWPTDILVAYIIGFMMLAVVILQYLKGLER